jgi:hypothetical protein
MEVEFTHSYIIVHCKQYEHIRIMVVAVTKEALKNSCLHNT